MELLSKLEHIVDGWFKSAPHLPQVARKWLGDNIWWIAAITAVAVAVGVLGLLVGVIGSMSALGSPYVAYYTSTTFVAWVVIKSIISLLFLVANGVLLGLAITPLREKQRRGWIYLFGVLLIGIVSVVFEAVITLTVLGFILNILLGAVWLAISAYFVFEIRGEFAHVERSKGVKKSK